MEFDADNELNCCALRDAVRYACSGEGDCITQNLVWKNMQNSKGQRENFTGSVEP